MRSLQASTSYSVAVPSFHITPRHHIPRRHAISAKVEPSEKSVEIMRKFSEQYARKSGTYFCVDKGVTSVVIKGRNTCFLDCHTVSDVTNLNSLPFASREKLFVSVIDADIQIETKNLREIVEGLAEHKDTLGAPLCPCRHYDDKSAEAGQGFWNCPCVPMRERKQCHCMLFLTPENDFAGREQAISMDEIKVRTSNM